MLIIGVAFDIYNLLKKEKKEDKVTTDGTGDFTHGFSFTYLLRNACWGRLKTMIQAQHFIYMVHKKYNRTSFI